jgi:hypothetical protein
VPSSHSPGRTIWPLLRLYRQKKTQTEWENKSSLLFPLQHLVGR